MDEIGGTSVPRWFWIVAILGLLWNLMGCAIFAMELFAQDAMIESWTDEQKEWAKSTPGWLYALYALAVGCGLGGCILLLLRKPVAILLFAISLASILVQMTYSMIIAGGFSVMGPSSIIMPCIVIALGSGLLWFAWFAKAKQWLVAERS